MKAAPMSRSVVRVTIVISLFLFFSLLFIKGILVDDPAIVSNAQTLSELTSGWYLNSCPSGWVYSGMKDCQANGVHELQEGQGCGGYIAGELLCLRPPTGVTLQTQWVNGLCPSGWVDAQVTDCDINNNASPNDFWSHDIAEQFCDSNDEMPGNFRLCLSGSSGSAPQAQWATTCSSGYVNTGLLDKKDNSQHELNESPGSLGTAKWYCLLQSPPPFDFSLSNEGSRSVIQGQSVMNTVTATLISGTTQSVSFSASDLPAGATASFNPTSCNPNCWTTMTITTIATTPTGNPTITVTGTGGGLTRTSQFTLIVNAAASPPPPLPPPPSSQPNLIITNFSVLNGIAGNTGIANITIKNNGTVSTSNSFKVGFHDGSPSITSISCSNKETSVSLTALAGGSSQIVSVPFTYPAAGTYTARALVDSDCVISESDETDNTSIGYIYTSSAPSLPPPPPPLPPPLEAPFLSATATCSPMRTDLSWNNVNEANDYYLYRCTGSGCIPTVQITATQSVTYSDTALVENNTYSYRVRAHRNTDGSYSGYSNTVEAIPVCAEAILPPPPPPDQDVNIQPSSSITVSPAGLVSGTVSIFVDVLDAERVELYVIREGSLVPAYLGTAFVESGSKWKYVWDSRTTPNGTYYLFARITNRFGSYESAKRTLDIFNEQETIVATSDQEIQQIKDISTEVQAIESESALTESEFKTETSSGITDYSARISESIQTFGVQDSDALRRRVIQRTQEIRAAFEEFLNSEITNLAQAIRAKNDINIERIRNRIREIFQSSLLEIDRVISDAGVSIDTRTLKSEIEAELERTLEELQALIAKREEIIRERVGLRGFRDTDNDGIADYDEVNIYTTDPAAADTDGDGFIDGAEILGGFNPVDASKEASITYEDPHTAGIVQGKLFAIENVSVESTGIDETTQAPSIEKIRFSGIALPNSFVTLYIFSEPIIVTVKTDNGGKWSYVFDKQLPDGRHEVFAAITDNTGQIVAKSNAVPFVKEAQALAFGEENINALLAPDTSPGFFEGNFMYIAIGFLAGIVSIALIMLGRRKKDETISN